MGRRTKIWVGTSDGRVFGGVVEKIKKFGTNIMWEDFWGGF